VKPSGRVNVSFDCLEKAQTIESYVSSSDFNALTVPENRIISKDNIF